MAHLPLGNNLTDSDVVIINRFVWNVISHDVRIIDPIPCLPILITMIHYYISTFYIFLARAINYRMHLHLA